MWVLYGAQAFNILITLPQRAPQAGTRETVSLKPGGDTGKVPGVIAKSQIEAML